MEQGKLTLSELAEKSVFEIGTLIEKGLAPATPAIKKFAEDASKHLEKVKQQAIAFNKLEKDFKIAPDRNKFNELLKTQNALSEQNIVLGKEQNALEKNLIKTIAKYELATESTNKALIKKRFELNQLNKIEKENAILNSKSSSELQKATVKRARAIRSIQDLNIKRELGNKLSNTEQRELRQSSKEYLKYDKAIKIAKTSTGQFQENVGNYPKTFGIALKSMLPLIGAGLGLREAINFTKEARQLAIEAKGVDFAFAQIEARTGDAENALLRVKESTRGLLSDLDIKKAIVELDNFNIGTEETATLMEFLAVRANQTGQSIDSLQSSLVEGLSKESKLRIDNLGISTAELNAELEKTPNFVQAVANIARKEIKEAGNILDEAGNSQEKWNAELDNFKLALGQSSFVSKFSDGLFSIGTNLLRMITPSKKLTDVVRDEQKGLNNLVTSIIQTNDKEEDRKVLIDELVKKYPFFLKFLKDEKTDNDSLRTALSSVNDMYVKKIALRRVEEKLKTSQEKEGLRLDDLSQRKIKYQQYLSDIATFYLKNENLIRDTQKETTKAVQKELERRILKYSMQSSEMTTIQRNTFNAFKNAQKEILEYEKSIAGSNYLLNDARSLSEDVKEEMANLEEILGISKKEIDEIFSGEGIVLTFSKKTNDNGVESYLDQQAKDEYELQKFRLEQSIITQDAILDNEKSTGLEKIRAVQEREAIEIELAELTEKHLLRNKNLTKDARILIEEQTSAKLIEIYKNTNEEIDKLQEDFINNAPETVSLNFDDGDIDILKQGIKDYAETLGLDGEKALEEFVDLHGYKFEAVKEYYDNLDKRAEESKEDRLEAEKEIAEKVMELASSVSDFIGTLSDAKIQGIEYDIDKNNERYDNAINNAQDQYDAEGNLLESSERRKEILEAERDAKNKILEKQKKEEQRKQAIREKAFSIFQIGINTASAVVEALPSIPLSILAGVIGAVQLATVIATPLPKYKQGRKGGKAEWAITGDGGVNEFVEKKDGSIYKTPNKDTLTYLEKDDIVHKDYNALKIAKGLSEDTFNQLYRTVAGANLQSKYDRASDVQQKITINNRINEQVFLDYLKQSEKNQLKNFQKAMKGVTIKSQPTINIPTNYQKG